MDRFSRVLFNQAYSVLPAVLTFLEASDIPHLFGVSRAAHKWYTEVQRVENELTGCDISWSILLIRDYGSVHSEFLFGGNIVDTTILSEWEPFLLLRKCLFFHESSRIWADGEYSVVSLRQTLPALYAFFSKNPINTPLCSMWKVEMYDHDYSDVNINRVDEIVDRLDLNIDDHRGFREAYVRVLRFIVSRMTETGGLIASLEVDRKQETSGIKLNIMNSIGHSIDIPHFEDVYRLRATTASDTDVLACPRNQRDRIRFFFEKLGIAPDRRIQESAECAPSVVDGTSPYDLESFCRLYVDSLGRLCVFDWMSKSLIPVTFESSGTFIINLRGADGEALPSFRLSPLLAFNPHPYRLRCSRTPLEMTSKVPNLDIPHSVYNSRLLRHNELCDAKNGVTTQHTLKPGIALGGLPPCSGFLDGLARANAPSVLLQESPFSECYSQKRSLSHHDVKHLYFRECLKSLYPLFVPYDEKGGPKTAGLFYGCYALHGIEVVQMTLEPFVDLKEDASSNDDRRKFKNERWMQIPPAHGDRPQEHYVDIDVSHITEGSNAAGAGGAESCEVFGIQLQGLKISGDRNVPGGKLSFCFNALEVLPSHICIPKDDEISAEGGASPTGSANAATDADADAQGGVAESDAAASSSAGVGLMGTYDIETLEAREQDRGQRESFSGGFLPPLVESMLSSSSNSDASTVHQQHIHALQEFMQSRVRAMFHNDNPEMPQRFTAWEYADPVMADLASEISRNGEVEAWAFPIPRSFPMDRTEHVLHVLSGHSVTNEFPCRWEPMFAKASLLIYDRHVYEEENVVFTIIFEREMADNSMFYIDFRPFQTKHY